MGPTLLILKKILSLKYSFQMGYQFNNKAIISKVLLNNKLLKMATFSPKKY